MRASVKKVNERLLKQKEREEKEESFMKKRKLNDNNKTEAANFIENKIKEQSYLKS